MQTALHGSLLRATLGIALMLAFVVGVAANSNTALAAVSGTADVSPTLIDPQNPAADSASVTLTLEGQTETSSTPTDLVLVLDESGSLNSSEFGQQRSFAIDIVNSLATDGLFANGGRVGIVLFSTNARVILSLSNSHATVISALNSMAQIGGGTCIPCGMDRANNMIATLSPATSNRVMIVTTDGFNTLGSIPTEAAQSDALGIERFAVGIGPSVSIPELNAVASDPDSTHVFFASNFSALAAILESLVEAVTQPGGTNIEVVATVNAAFDVANVVASHGSVSQSGQVLTWTIDQLDTEIATLTYDVSSSCDFAGQTLAVHDSVTYSDDQGHTVSFPDLEVSVAECNEAPDCTNAGPSIDEIWSPNHKMVSVSVVGVTDADGDAVTITVDSIWQDEPTNTNGDGNTAIDGAGVGTDTAEVRAERTGDKKVPGNGRVYHIGFTADDGNGGSCSGTVTVGVPHDQGQGTPAVDDGALYDSTVATP